MAEMNQDFNWPLGKARHTCYVFHVLHFYFPITGKTFRFLMTHLLFRLTSKSRLLMAQRISAICLVKCLSRGQNNVAIAKFQLTTIAAINRLQPIRSRCRQTHSTNAYAELYFDLPVGGKSLSVGLSGQESLCSDPS